MKNIVKRALLETRILRLASLVSPPKVSILRYHSVQDDPEPYANTIGRGIIHTTAAFREQMEIVARNCNPVSIQDILGFLSSEHTLPRRAVAVTFDDGYADNYEIAAPVLNKVGVPAAFYVTVGDIESRTPPWYCRLRHAFSVTAREGWSDSKDNGARPLETPAERKVAFLLASRRCSQLVGWEQARALEIIERELGVETLETSGAPMMTWDQARRLQRDGHIVGSHTMTHPNLAWVDEAARQKELLESRRIMEEKLQGPAIHFSYPSPIADPHFTKQTIESTKQAGYKTAVTCARGPVRKGEDALCLPRVFAPLERHEFCWALEASLVGLAEKAGVSTQAEDRAEGGMTSVEGDAEA